jgi:hypothetical protein
MVRNSLSGILGGIIFTAMSLLIPLAILVLLTGAAILALAIKNAPEGYETEEGFHLVRQPARVRVARDTARLPAGGLVTAHGEVAGALR